MNKGIYISLLHGRSTIDEEMDTWGYMGPIIGPVQLSYTYRSIKLHSPDWLDFDFLPEVKEEGLIKFNGKYYGDFEILRDDDPCWDFLIKDREVIDYYKFSQIIHDER